MNREISSKNHEPPAPEAGKRGSMLRSEALILEAIPLLMGGVCLGFGLYVWHSQDSPPFFVAGHVVTFLAAICLALFCTAATIIQQLIDRYNAFYRYSLPMLGYAAAAATFGWGIQVINAAPAATDHIIAGHVVCGLGLISACVSTVATASTRFLLIPRNSRSPSRERPPEAFSPGAGLALVAIPVLCAGGGFGWAMTLLLQEGSPGHFVAGHVLAGLSLICAALITLVASVVRQIANIYQPWERRAWPWTVAGLGAVNLAWGLTLVLLAARPGRVAPDWLAYWVAPGWVMMGLGMVCFSILSKVALLALVWRRTFALAKRIPLIPVGTTLVCLFAASFLFQDTLVDPNVVIPARVLVGLGAVCFTLFSIVSILESGTSGGQG